MSFLFCKMVLKGIQSIFIFSEMIWNKIPRSSDLFYETVQHKVPSVFLVYKMCETEFCFFLIFRKMAWNRIPSIFRSSKQAEFQRNESKFPSVPYSVE
jgi:hypothetical protein